MTTICPKCSLKQNDSVPICDCGFDLAAYRQSQKALQRARRAEQAPSSRLWLWRIALWLCGALSVLIGLTTAVIWFVNGGDIWTALVAVLIGLITAVVCVSGAEALGYLLRVSAQLDDVATLVRQTRDEDERGQPA